MPQIVEERFHFRYRQRIHAEVPEKISDCLHLGIAHLNAHVLEPRFEPQIWRRTTILAVPHFYGLKKIITKFAVKNTCPHAAVFESGDLTRRGMDRYGPAFLVILFLRGLFADPFLRRSRMGSPCDACYFA
jgi:hypothetical protein